MRKPVRLAISALIVVLLLGVILPFECSAQSPFAYRSVFAGSPGPFTYRTYTQGYASSLPSESWYYTYYPGAPGYDPNFRPGVLDYSYFTTYSPLYGYNNYYYYSWPNFYPAW